MPVLENVTAQDVADWLSSLPRTCAVPVMVRIGRAEYVGASYSQERDVSPGCAAYARGERVYLQHALYLLGSLPASYVRSSRTAYRFADGRRRWYVASWYQGEDANEYHPFGKMFQLMPDRFDVTDGYEERVMR